MTCKRRCVDCMWLDEAQIGCSDESYLSVQICHARPSVANLKQFPFRSTACGEFSPKEG